MATIERARAASLIFNGTSRQAQQLLGVEEAARLIGLSVWTLRAWAYSGKITSHKISTRLMFHVDDLQEIVESSRRPAKHEAFTARLADRV